jgi:YD repeat-containing protein
MRFENMETYSYDAIDQVTGVTKPGNTQTFAYDATGKRTTVSATTASPGVGSYTTNALNQRTPGVSPIILMF